MRAPSRGYGRMSERAENTMLYVDLTNSNRKLIVAFLIQRDFMMKHIITEEMTY